MKKFICHLAQFLIPFYFVGVVIGVYWGVGYNIGELQDFNDILLKQREDNTIYIGMSYNEQTAYYKTLNANYYQADVISLGTSRMMQFKEDYFATSFYNCGGVVRGNYDEYLNFVKSLNYYPKMILLGLDAWVFNDAWNKGLPPSYEYEDMGYVDRNKLVILRDMMLDCGRGKWKIKQIHNFPLNYGLSGRVLDAGFRSDGSMYYGYNYQRYETGSSYGDTYLKDAFKRIEDGNNGFEWGEHVDRSTYDKLAELLNYCRNNNIDVIGILTPFAPSVYNQMVISGNYQYLEEISPLCVELFQEYGFEYFDYMSGTLNGMDDTYYVDGMHGSEVVYAFIINDMFHYSNVLCEYMEQDRLSSLIQEPYSHLMLEEQRHRKL